ncbi:unnamed protein product [Tetraodon nigroviridis]|uniref:(spotted green pufferfish) hypothetical protein n=1 Tax=Tetraodon nigroviridis TaxID=99883 RepID=Q4RY96_TETNG|nr:unnamed protein product [Tetraodon nigroviridis]
MPVVETAPAEFEKPTRRHGVKLNPAVACSVEEAALAVGNVVGHESVKSASRMNGEIVIFVDGQGVLAVGRRDIKSAPVPGNVEPSQLSPSTAAVAVNTPVVAEPVAPALMEALTEEVPPTVEPSPVSDDTNAGLAAELTLQELHTATLSLQNGKTPGIDGLPVEFYKAFWDVIGGDLLESVFKVWGMIKKERQEQVDSAYWLQQEPVLWGTKLDLPNWMSETITGRMKTTGIGNLGQVVALTGPQMDNPSGLAAQLGVNSLRIVQILLDHWKSKLSLHDRVLLTSSTTVVVEEEPFPTVALALDFKDCNGPLLKDTPFISLQETSGKTFYKMMVKALNKQGLNQRADMPWRRYLNLAPDCRPQWRALYKPPLSKRHADLHWRVLHGIFPVNSCVVEDKCPFCDQKETIFHCFYECRHLLPLFSFLQSGSFQNVRNSLLSRFLFLVLSTHAITRTMPALKLCFRAGQEGSIFKLQKKDRGRFYCMNLAVFVLT